MIEFLRFLSPLNVNPTKKFKNLAIEDPKDIKMLDHDETDHSTSKAEARAVLTTKANSGSNTSHLASPSTQPENSAAVTDQKEKEQTVNNLQEVEFEDAIEEVVMEAEAEKGDGAKGEDEEVEIIDEVEGVEKAEELENERREPGIFLSRDIPNKEVKAGA